MVVTMALLLAEHALSETKPIFSELEDEFIYTSLSFSPVSATSAGYHRHQGIHLDRQLDDFSAASLDRQKKFYENIRGRLRAAGSQKLSPEDRTDYDIMMGQIELALLDLDTIQSYRHNPTVYVELIGNALFNPLSLEYALKSERIREGSIVPDQDIHQRRNALVDGLRLLLAAIGLPQGGAIVKVIGNHCSMTFSGLDCVQDDFRRSGR